MLEQCFRGLFDTDMTAVISVGDFLLCLGTALLLGLLLALAYSFRTRATRSFVATLALLPAVVCAVIMMVNGNVGTGVAVAGAFSLVRFRSAPGTAKEIGALFLAMGAGLIAGMGYLGYAFLFTLLLGGVSMLYSALNLGAKRRGDAYKTLHVTVPEDLDYTGAFEELLDAYCGSWELTSVKTTNLGSLFRLTYDVTFKDPRTERELIDKLRCRNGNLEISVSRQETVPLGL